MRSNPLLDDPFVNCALFCQNNFILTRDIGLEHLKPIHWKNEVNYNIKQDETEKWNAKAYQTLWNMSYAKETEIGHRLRLYSRWQDAEWT